MAVIKVPKPQGVIDPDRPVNALLKAQVEHLHEAERALPLKYRSEIYIRTIQTEGEAAEYIREITEAIHAAHRDAQQKRERAAATEGKPVISIAAAADEGAERRAAKPAAKRPQKKIGSPGNKKSKK